MKQSLMVNYAMKKKAKKMADGGEVADKPKTIAQQINYPGTPQSQPSPKPTPKGYARGGFVEEEEASGFADHEGNVQRPNGAAIAEDDLDLNQHAVVARAGDPMAPEVDGEMHEKDMDYSDLARLAGGGIVDRIMRKRYSEGGMVANGGEDDLNKMADGRRNNFDDLALRDTLESSSNGSNNGDFLSDDREDSDRKDIVSRVMRSWGKKDRNPRPA